MTEVQNYDITKHQIIITDKLKVLSVPTKKIGNPITTKP